MIPPNSRQKGARLSTLIPRPDMTDCKEERPKRWRKSWRFTLYSASVTGLLVLCFNLGFLLWVLPRHNFDNERGTLYDGNCDKVHDLSIGLHLVINIFSTLLLSASNYTIQCLSAPTRADLDNAHKELCWLDIGILSVRNFRQISRPRSALWVILVLSSLPLHLMYNSTIFATTSSNSYYAFLGDRSFGQTALEDLTLAPSDPQLQPLDNYEPRNKSIIETFTHLYDMSQNGVLEELDNAACIDAYTKTYQNSYVNVLLVTDMQHNKSEYRYVGYQEVYRPVTGSPFTWICPNDYEEATKCQSKLLNTKPEIVAGNWEVLAQPIKYCLAEVAQPHCKLQYSLPLTVVVMVFILVKAITICYVAITIDTPILTVGDAIASFLEKPDTTVRGKCLLSMKDLTGLSNTYDPFWIRRNRWVFFHKPKQWRSAVSPGRWCFAMTMSAEWSQYATQRKGLRVSAAPNAAQRSKYFLSLPYRYAIPLMTTSGILHWLISQSFFLVGIEAYDQNLQRDPASDISVCGYSPIAIVCSISLGTAMIFCLVGLGFKRFKSGMPVVGSCSLAIAAACFPDPGTYDPEKQAGSTPDMVCLALKWGVVLSEESSVGHCAFSSKDVTMPVDGEVYH
ncbi:hypothetical protein TMEN_5282 [Trichophyton mentagrophytes]|nr:hypothetical protein TMEN_5282 [Trichophyton mentagrophytes]